MDKSWLGYMLEERPWIVDILSLYALESLKILDFAILSDHKSAHSANTLNKSLRTSKRLRYLRLECGYFTYSNPYDFRINTTVNDKLHSTKSIMRYLPPSLEKLEFVLWDENEREVKQLMKAESEHLPNLRSVLVVKARSTGK